MTVRLAATALALAGFALAAPAARAAKDPREATARRFFAAGKYESAIEVYAEIYQDRPHANYLFNIGRCYQNLDEPDRAIASFREFLRRAERVAPKEKARAETFIREMEERKVEREKADKALPPPPEDERTAHAPAASGNPDPVPAFLARLRAAGETGWRAHAAVADAAKLATLARTERMLAGAKPDDPRRPDYQLFVANGYAGSFYERKLAARAARRAAVDGDGDPTTGGDQDAHALEAEANQAFLHAVELYVSASRAAGFKKGDEALYRLGLLLAANGMEPRARQVLTRLVRGYPDSRWVAEIAAVP